MKTKFFVLLLLTGILFLTGCSLVTVMPEPQHPGSFMYQEEPFKDV